MKIMIYLAVWRRPEITEICFMCINRLREAFDIDAFAVISEEEMKPLCDRYDVKYCMYKNLPLGEKKNYGLSQALKLDWDYLLEIGSDTLVKDKLLRTYTWDVDVMGALNFGFIHEDGVCRELKAKVLTFSGGRAISRKAAMSGKLWNDQKNRGLDNNSLMRLCQAGFFETRFQTDEPLVIDVRGPDNIWPDRKSGVKCSFDYLVNGLSDQEIKAIRSYVGNQN